MKKGLAVEINLAELAVRLCEANYGLVRPMTDPHKALEAMEPEVRLAWLRSAQVAAKYFAEVAGHAQRVN